MPFAKLTPEHCLENGLKLGATRTNDTCLITHVTNITLSGSVAQHALSAVSYTEDSKMTNEACVVFCDAKGYVSALDFLVGGGLTLD